MKAGGGKARGPSAHEIVTFRDVAPFLAVVTAFTAVTFGLAFLLADSRAHEGVMILAVLLTFLGGATLVGTLAVVGSTLALRWLWLSLVDLIRARRDEPMSRGSLRDEWLDGP